MLLEALYRPLTTRKLLSIVHDILEVKKRTYLSENDSEVRYSTSQGKDMESKSFSETPRKPF